MHLDGSKKYIKRTKGRVTQVDREKLKQLTDYFNLPEYMGELFLSELKLSKLPGDARAKEIARHLGLL